MLERFDGFLLDRVFQPLANAVAGIATPADVARSCVTGAMVFILAKMLVASAAALPDWTVVVDVLALWGGMAVLQALSAAPAGRFNPWRERFALARRVLAVITILLMVLGTRSLAASFGLMQCMLWCAALYFASCAPPQRVRIGRSPQ